jgi:hypothetical protein
MSADGRGAQEITAQAQKKTISGDLAIAGEALGGL